ncbi:LytR family transcriptional attenuator [Tamaricihabitans halophyticus]|uniref:LytR family transcriptional attenuator n=1 Tax=Tamaricihabitans halophyticus TaxID=1262583 RepID=A0A4R2R8V5_9PSEU|nr:LCP family protein [Tamaricihabitans halophyticus]TCP56091.1 LytR family transcriptional attenuator [Tamaricihabitans halophyticus]
MDGRPPEDEGLAEPPTRPAFSPSAGDLPDDTSTGDDGTGTDSSDTAESATTTDDAEVTQELPPVPGPRDKAAAEGAEPAPATAQPGTRRRTIAMRTGQSVVALLSVMVLAVTWYGWTILGNINSGLATTDVFDDTLPPKPLDGALDILLVGQDSRTDAQGNPLPDEVLAKLNGGVADGERQTDTMILVHIPMDGRRAVAISFPRDSWVELAGGYGTHKLNGAFVYAYNDTSSTLRQRGETDGEAIDEQATVAGRKNLIATIEKLIDRPGAIDRYAEVNLGSFYEVTKAIGGIEVCLNEATSDSMSGAKFKAGKQTISGAKALAFVRQRYGLPRSDFDRIVRQQAFISGLARKVISQDILTDPTRITELSDAIKKSVVLSEGWDLTEFAQQMQGLTGDNITFHTIPNNGNANIGGADVVDIDETDVREFFDEITGTEDGSEGSAQPDTDQDPRIPTINVEIYNGSSDAADASSAAKILSDKGFPVGEPVPASSRTDTVIRHPVGEEGNADLVQAALGEQVTLEPDADIPSGSIRVLLGGDFDGAQPDTPGSGGAGPDEDTTTDSADEPSGDNDSGNGVLPQGPTPTGGAGNQAQQEGDGSGEGDPTLDAGDVPCVN